MEKSELSRIIKLYPPLLTKLYLLIRHIESPLGMIDKYVPKKGRIADLGCGFGSFSIYLASKEKNRYVTGFELQESRVIAARNASTGMKNVKFEQRDFTNNTKIEEFDTIIMFDLLHHLPPKTQKKLIHESKNKLKKNGLLIIKDISDKPLWKYYYNYFQDKVMTKNDKLYFIPTEKMENLLKKEKFKIIDVTVLRTWFLNPIPHVVYVCQKDG